MSEIEVVENCSDTLKALWYKGSVEPYIERFYINKKTGKIKIKRN